MNDRSRVGLWIDHIRGPWMPMFTAEHELTPRAIEEYTEAVRYKSAGILGRLSKVGHIEPVLDLTEGARGNQIMSGKVLLSRTAPLSTPMPWVRNWIHTGDLLSVNAEAIDNPRLVQLGYIATARNVPVQVVHTQTTELLLPDEGTKDPLLIRINGGRFDEITPDHSLLLNDLGNVLRSVSLTPMQAPIIPEQTIDLRDAA